MSTADGITIDNAPPTRFHYRIAAFSAGGMFIDGYTLGALSIALPLLPVGFGMTPVWKGLVGSAALIGLFLGGLFIGPFIDSLGRKKLYTLDLTIFIFASLAQFFVQTPSQLFVTRLIAGIAIGIDYAVSPTYLSEFLPTKLRGPLLGSLAAVWRIGFLVAVLIGVLFHDSGPGIWRWILASSVVPSVVVTLLRVGVPESPRWLVMHGRVAEAEEVVKKYISPQGTVQDLVAAHEASSSQRAPQHAIRELLSPRWRKRTLFAGLFWIAQSTPQTAIFTFLPSVFVALGLSGGFTATLVQNAFFAGGGIVGMFVINKIGRRKLLISTFWLMAASVTALAVLPKPSAVIVVSCLCTYAFIEAIAGNLQFVYPSELFPTSIRGAGAGFAAAFSRIGAAFGTFVFPILLAGIGVRGVMYGAIGILIFGAVISHIMAPETGAEGLLEDSPTNSDALFAPGTPVAKSRN